jgi:hypothetical protein
MYMYFFIQHNDVHHGAVAADESAATFKTPLEVSHPFQNTVHLGNQSTRIKYVITCFMAQNTSSLIAINVVNIGNQTAKIINFSACITTQNIFSIA